MPLERMYFGIQSTDKTSMLTPGQLKSPEARLFCEEGFLLNTVSGNRWTLDPLYHNCLPIIIFLNPICMRFVLMFVSSYFKYFKIDFSTLLLFIHSPCFPEFRTSNSFYNR